MIWGCSWPLLVEQKDLVWGLIASMYLATSRSHADLRAAVRRDPARVVPVIALIIMVIARSALHREERDLDVWMMVVFDVSYLFKKLQHPSPACVAIVLGDNAESSFRQAMLMSCRAIFDPVLEEAGRLHDHARAVLLFWPLSHGCATRPSFYARRDSVSG
jgi:putative tricarboxylic transport membrane protein